MTTQPPIDASESQVGLPCSRSAVVHRHLGAAVADETARLDLYTALILGRVYLPQLQVLLDDDGPHVEFQTQSTRSGPAVTVFSSRSRVGSDVEPSAVESMPFGYLLHALPDGVGVVIDPDHEGYVIEPEEIEMLRQASPMRQH